MVERDERATVFANQFRKQEADLVEQLAERDRTIEAIMQGRVMRTMTKLQLWLRGLRQGADDAGRD